jgi:diguanylate cyclase (GGDEF)-like protein/PAS domain S-box-containing protein
MAEPQQLPEQRGRTRRASVLLVVAAMFVVFLGAAWAQRSLQERAERRRETELALTTILSRASQANLLLERAIDHRSLSDNILRNLASVNDEIDRSVHRLPSGKLTEDVRVAVASYQAALREDIALIRKGRIDEARILDEEKVDLWFEALRQHLDTALASLRATAASSRRVADRGSLAALALAFALVGLVLWRFERARMAAATVGQRVLQESEARFRALVQNSSDVITVVDEHGVITYQSPSSERVFQRSPEGVVGAHGPEFVRQLTHPDDIPELERVIAQAWDPQTEDARAELRLRKQDGSWRYVELAVRNSLDDPYVRGLVVTSRDITNRKVLEEQLRHQAFHDALTELPNRALLLDRMEVALARRSREKIPLALLLLDLDGFKRVNDSLGHVPGDDLLREVAVRLKRCVRAADSVARLGGDEFAVLLEEMDAPEDATVVAARILDELAQPFGIDGKRIFVRGSIGIVLSFTGERSADELLRDADVAMYSAKAEGKNRYHVFEPSMRTDVVHRMTLEADLRAALEKDQFLVCYQPIVELVGGRISGVEALLRWAHPERGLVSPAEFIPLAEESGLIVPIGLWVLQQACAQTAAWQREHPTSSRLNVSVNISGRQLQETDLATDIERTLATLDLAPGTLILEITESVLMRHTAEIADALARLRTLGVRLAIDDFGTGYSSLGYLQSFPIEILKIDRSFVTRVAAGPEESALARAILKLAHTLDLDICAEGIEEAEQLEALVALGCPKGQGYLFAPPVPAGTAGKLLQGQPSARARLDTASASTR